MNLLEMLAGSLSQDDSVNSISKKSGQSKSAILKLIAAAVPVLITYLTKNAKKKDGAESLANALGQHTSTSSLAAQLADADTEDGAKILQHILGSDSDAVTAELAKETGMDKKDVLAALDVMTPGMMSEISAAGKKASKKKQSGVDLSDGIDLSDVMGLFGAATDSSSGSTSGLGGLESLLGGFLGGSGGAAPKKSAMDGSDLLGMLAGLM